MIRLFQVTFITNPSMYIEKVAQYKINQIAGPNFAFGLMARKWPPNRKVVRYTYIHILIGILHCKHLTDTPHNNRISLR